MSEMQHSNGIPQVFMEKEGVMAQAWARPQVVWYAMLCYTMTYYNVLYYDMIVYDIIYYNVLWYSIL